jgi:hypothetical protein
MTEVEELATKLPGTPPRSPASYTNLCKSNPMPKSNTRFPLTPALSRRGRENRIQSLDNSNRYELPEARTKSTFSQRERAGVRGNEAHDQNPPTEIETRVRTSPVPSDPEECQKSRS